MKLSKTLMAIFFIVFGLNFFFAVPFYDFIAPILAIVVGILMFLDR